MMSSLSSKNTAQTCRDNMHGMKAQTPCEDRYYANCTWLSVLHDRCPVVKLTHFLENLFGLKRNIKYPIHVLAANEKSN